MSRPETPVPVVAAVAPRAFVALAAGFLLLYAGILMVARQQRAARAQLESVVPLPPRTEAATPTPREP